MKRLIAGLVFILSGTVFAQQAQMHISDLSGGMYSYQSPNKIPDNTAPLIRNFFTDQQPMAVERNGFSVLDSSLGGGAVNVSGMWKFVDSSGNEWIIEYASRTYSKHVLGGTPTTFGFATTTSNIPRAAINLGKIMFVDGVDTPWTFDGTTSATVPSAPIGALIVAWRTRFVIGSITGAQSTLRFSGDGDATSWTLGPNPTDPFSIQIGGANDGYRITCLGIYQDYLIAQKKYQTWAISGFDQSDVLNRNISPEIGCIEPGTNREFDNMYLFLSARGVEAMTGGQIQRISDPVRDITDAVVKNTVNQRSITQTSQTDWIGGAFLPNTWIDTTGTPGRIQTIFPDTFDAFRDGSSATAPVWTGPILTGGTPPTGSITAAGTLNIVNGGGTLGRVVVESAAQQPAFLTAGTSVQVDVTSIPTDTGNFSRFIIGISSVFVTGGGSNLESGSDYFYFDWRSTATGRANLAAVQDNEFDAGMLVSTSVAQPFTFSYWMNQTSYSYGVNGVTLKSGTHTHANNTHYMVMEHARGPVGSATLSVDNYEVAPQTCTFTTSAMNPGTSVASWSTIDVTDVQLNPSSVITYQAQSSTNSNTAFFSGAWTSITNHAVPSISTNPYVAVRALINETALSGFSAAIDDITVNWLEGSAPAMASIVYDGRYWLSYTDQTGAAPRNSKVLVWQRNHTWTQLDIGASSYAIWRDKLYFGDSAQTAQSYQYDIGNTDGGANITSQIKFKSYDAGAFSQDKDFRQTYLSFLGNVGYSGTFSLAYFVNQETTSSSLGSMNMSDGTGQVLEKLPFLTDGTMPLQGREIQYSLLKSGSGDRLKLFDIALDFSMKEER